jgi:hypothetical protein
LLSLTISREVNQTIISPQFFKALPPYQDYFQKYLNYYDRIGLWADIFGENRVQPRVFDKKYLYGEDVVADFFNILGATKTIHAERINESNGFVKTKVNLLFNHIDIAQNWRLRLRPRLDNSGRLTPARQEAIDFYSYFKESNRRLNHQFNLTPEEFLFDDDFSIYPATPGDLWTEDSANDAILSLLEGIKMAPSIGPDDADLLHNCISALKEIDSQSAIELQALFDRCYSDHYKPRQKLWDRAEQLRGRLISLLSND